MSYNPKISQRKGVYASIPAGAVLVAVWASRQFFGVEVPAEVALVLLGAVAYTWAWLRNKAKNAWKL